MNSGICNLPLVPLRAEPSEKSEMVTQMLFGELFDLLEEQGGWCRIRVYSDSYVGWCTSKMLQRLHENIFKTLSDRKPFLTSTTISRIQSVDLNDCVMCLPAGSRLYRSDENSDNFELYKSEEENVNKECWQLIEDNSVEENDAVRLAMRFLNAPYLWGGKSILGMDCSGLVQIVFSIIGIQLPRDARLQALHGTIVPKISDINAGDLAFFKNTDGKIVHVGICLGSNNILHASGSVHIDKLDEYGVFSKKLASYTHKLYQIRRILPVNA